MIWGMTDRRLKTKWGESKGGIEGADVRKCSEVYQGPHRLARVGRKH